SDEEPGAGDGEESWGDPLHGRETPDAVVVLRARAGNFGQFSPGLSAGRSSNVCSILPVPMVAYAELHCHTNFSFLDGASALDGWAERAIELGRTGLGIPDHQGLYGVVRAAATYEEIGLHPVLGIEVELRDPLVPDPDRIVVPARRSARRGGRRRTTA